MTDRADAIKRLRREPPAFRRVTIGNLEQLTPRLLRIEFVGPELEGLTIDEPAASIRLLLPSAGSDELVIPEWTGNEFLLPDGSRPLIRTFTPRRMRHDPPQLDVDVVLHGDEGASRWGRHASVGDPAAVSGPGRGYAIDPASDPLVLLGDETAIPAIAQLLESVPGTTPIAVHIEARPDAHLDLPPHPLAHVSWHAPDSGDDPGAALLPALQGEDLGPGARVWAAGEAAAMQRVRRHLTEERRLDRSRITVRGYWKHGRPGPG